jgi:hypothetical protein
LSIRRIAPFCEDAYNVVLSTRSARAWKPITAADSHEFTRANPVRVRERDGVPIEPLSCVPP